MSPHTETHISRRPGNKRVRLTEQTSEGALLCSYTLTNSDFDKIGLAYTISFPPHKPYIAEHTYHLSPWEKEIEDYGKFKASWSTC